MGLDLSFLLGGPQGAVQMPNPVQQYGMAMSLAQLARQNRIGDLAEREQSRQLEEEDAYRAALPALLQAGFSREAVLQAIQADPRIGQRAVKEADARQKSEADLAKTRAGTFKDSVEAKAKAMDDIAAIANAEASKPNPSLSRVQRVAEFYGVPLPQVRGDDPESLRGYIQSLADAGISVKDQIAVKQKDRDFTAGEVEKMWRREFDTGKQADTVKYQQGTLASQAADRSQRMTVAKMADDRARDFNATTREGVQATREAAAGQRLNTETQSLAKMVDSNVLPNLVASGNAVEAMLDKYKGKNIPGMGLTRMLPDFLVSAEGKDARSSVQGMANDLLKLYSGGAVTMSEDERRTVEMMANGTFTDQDFRNAWPRIKARINEAQANIRAGYSPEAVATYEKRGGGGLKPIGSAPAGAPQTFDRMPPASQYPGRRMADDQGNVWRSDGKNWSRE